MKYELTGHARDMLIERSISLTALEDTIDAPDWSEVRQDGNRHYFKALPAAGGRVLHVVASTERDPPRIVTFFLDRRARRRA